MTSSMKKTWLLVSTVVIVVVLLIVGVYWWRQQSNTPSASTDTPAGTSDKTSLPDNPGPISSDKVPHKEGVKVTITRVEQKDSEVTIEGAFTGASEGMCVAEFTTPNDLPVILEAQATKTGEGAACGPMTHPAADFAYLGEWEVVLKVYTGGGKAESAPQRITIK